MSTPKLDPQKNPAKWVEKADSDYEAAQRLCEGEPLRAAVAFHCQQAVEKYIKAFLVEKSVEFPKTHDIRYLLDLVESVSPDLASLLSKTTRLTPYGVNVRYPGDFPEVLVGGEKELFALATLTRNAVMDRLRPFLQQ